MKKGKVSVVAKQLNIMNKVDPLLHSFLEYCKIEHLPTKQLVVRPGDPADNLYYIIEGSATVSMEDEEGNDIILTYLNDGDFIGETGLFIQQRTARQVTVRTRTPCTVAQITYDRLEELSKTELKDEFANILRVIATHVWFRQRGKLHILRLWTLRGV